MVNIAVIGTNTSVKGRLDAWSGVNGIYIAGIVVIEKECNVSLASQYNTELFNSLEELLNSRNVDLIDICLPPLEQAQYVMETVKKQKHVICANPLLDLERSAVLQACREYHVQLYNGHTLRFTPPYIDAHKQVKDGTIGRPGVIRLSRAGSCSGDTRLMAGEDSMLAGGIYEFDWLRWTFGEVERVMAKRISRKAPDGKPLEYALVTLRLQDGTIAHVELSSLKPSYEASYELAGDEGMLVYTSKDSAPISIQVMDEQERDGSVTVPEDIFIKPPLKRQLEYFENCFEYNLCTSVTIEDSFKALEIVQAAIQSADTGKPVSLHAEKEVR